MEKHISLLSTLYNSEGKKEIWILAREEKKVWDGDGGIDLIWSAFLYFVLRG